MVTSAFPSVKLSQGSNLLGYYLPSCFGPSEDSPRGSDQLQQAGRCSRHKGNKCGRDHSGCRFRAIQLTHDRPQTGDGGVSIIIVLITVLD